MPINKDIYIRLKQLVDHFSERSATRFAREIGQKQNTFGSYLSPIGQDKVKISLVYEILERYPEINPAWLFTGEGEMLGSAPALQTAGPEQKEPTPLERELKTFEAMMLKYDAPAEDIRKGLMARMGVAENCDKSTAYGASKSQTDSGATHIHEDPAGFGKKA